MNSKLAIFFHPYFSDGGVERTNIYLAKGLLEKGYDVEFLTSRATNHYIDEVESLGISMVELGDRRTIYLTCGVVEHLRVSAQRYDKIYFIGCQYYVNVVSMFIALILRNEGKIRFINCERNHFQEFAVRGSLKDNFIFYLARLLYRFADVVVANSEETARDLAKLIGRPVSYVYNPTINERIDKLRQEPVDEEWFLKDNRPCVIGVGRLSNQKDFSALIRAFRRVRNKINAKLVILGEGELRGEIEDLVVRLDLKEDVYLPGFVENPYKFLAKSDLFVLSSKYEGMPNVLIEAVFLGVPCIATSCKSGPKEVLINGEGGVLVPVGDEHRMAESIVNAICRPDDSKGRAKRAAEHVYRFHYAKVQEEFERVINL